jgi:hypothetical protein
MISSLASGYHAVDRGWRWEWGYNRLGRELAGAREGGWQEKNKI